MFRYLFKLTWGLLFVLCSFSAMAKRTGVVSSQRQITLNYLSNSSFNEIENLGLLVKDLELLYQESLEQNDEDLAKRVAMARGFLALNTQKNVTGIKWLSDVFSGGFDLTKSDSAAIIYQLRSAYINLGAYEKAMEMHMLFRPLASEYLTEVNRKTDDNVLAKLYLEIGNYPKAIKHYRDLVKVCDENNYIRSLAKYNNDIGVCYERMGNADSAIWYYELSEQIIKEELLSVSNQLFDSFFLALVQGNRGQILGEWYGEFAEAIPLLEKDLYYSKRISDFNNASLTCNHLAQVYFDMGSYRKCLEYAQVSIYYSKKIEVPNNMVASFWVKANSFVYLNQKDSAIFYFRASTSLKDSILKNIDIRKSYALQAAYNVEQKKAELLQQKRLVQETSFELNRRTGQNQRIIFVLVLLGASLILLYLAYFQKQKRERKLRLIYSEVEKQKRIIEQTLSDKNLLLKEVHHRVKNNLQVISSLFELQLLRTNDEKLKQSIIEGQNRVKTMALIHQKLYQTEEIKNLPFRGYVVDLVNTLIQTYKKNTKQIDVKIASDKVQFSMDLSIPIGLIINELVSNTLKYAFDETIEEPRISIVLKEISDDNYFFKFSDNGKGLPEGFNASELNSLGMKLIRILALQIEAEWSISGDEGTVFVMKFNSQ